MVGGKERDRSPRGGKYVQVAGPLSLAPRFNRTKLRDEVLQAFNIPILFVATRTQGSNMVAGKERDWSPR